MGRRKTKGRKGRLSKLIEDEDHPLLTQQTIPSHQELQPLPSSRYSTQSNNAKVMEPNMQFYTHGDQAEVIASQPSGKDCELNREASPNLTDLVQKLNKNVSDAEEVDSATHTALVTVAGYKVKGEVASLLREILSEHGDIASECILQTPETRATLLESVCMIYRELEPKFPNITTLEVNSIQARIKDLEMVRLRVQWLYKRLQQISTVKGLLDKSRSLDEARSRCAESIEREERDLEALEAELSNLQQKLSSKKAELALLKSEAETIEAVFETMALPEQSVVSMTRQTRGTKRGRPIPRSKDRNDAQLRSQTTLHRTNTVTHQQPRENDHPQADHVSVAYFKDQSFNPRSHSHLLDLPCNSRRPHSLAQSISRNLQHCSRDSNLLAHSNRLSNPHHPAQFSSENECDQNYDASSDDVHDMNTPGDDYTPENNGGSLNQGYITESSSKRVRGIRGITKPLRWWGTGQKMMLQLDEHNQIIGKLAAPFASQLGVLAKDGKKLPLIYTDWRTIPGLYKERIWKEIKDNTNLHDTHQRAIFQKLSLIWRCWKGKVKKLHFTPYMNDNEKLAQHPPDARIEKDQWPILVQFWKSKAVLETSTRHLLGDGELEPERLGQASSKVLADTNMKVPEYRKKALDMAVRAQGSEVVGNMHETMGVELVEVLSGMKQKSKSGIRGHMAFLVSPKRTQVRKSSSLQPATSYFEDRRRERLSCDPPSIEVGPFRKRKKMQLGEAANLEGLYTSTS